jgi:2Fe-2S ferredoxin
MLCVGRPVAGNLRGSPLPTSVAPYSETWRPGGFVRDVTLTICGQAITCRGHQVLLEVLQVHGWLLPAACSGRGICHMCRVRVEGLRPPEPTAIECRALSLAELARGERLACQVRVVAGLDVRLPPLLPPAASE